MPEALLDLLLRHPLVLDAHVLERDGRQVAYVVPAGEPAPARRAASALGAAQGVLVTTVTAIPRDAAGAPDTAALHLLPVPESVEPQPVPLAPPKPGRRHLGDVVALPTPWAEGPAPALDDVPVVAGGPPSECAGPELTPRPDDPGTLVEALLAAARTAPDRGVHLADSEQFLGYPELLDTARRTLAGLRAAGLRPGDPAVLHTPSPAEHVIGLWACLLGGVLPVAVAQAPDYDTPNAVLDKLLNICRDLGDPVVLSGGATVAALHGHVARVVDLAGCAAHEPAEIRHPSPDDTAVLQLSSGSTGKSKVIQLTHRGIIRYAQAARVVSDMAHGDVFVNWLPLDHVAGLVMFHLGPVVLRCDNVQAATDPVLADPLRWLDLLDRFRAQHSWSPNFGYRALAEALAGQPVGRWDLGCVKTLTNAGEQCTEPVMTAFARAVAPHGIPPHGLVLAWGMAETCTTAVYQRFGPEAVQHVRQAAPGKRLELVDEPAPGTTTFLSMGAPAPGTRFRVVGPDGSVLPEGCIGRLQGIGERITPGYRDNATANAEAFTADGWFDTGDLAFVLDGRVTITGRAKEVIIVNGVHHYCHDIEDVLGAVDGVAPGFAAAFGVPGADGVERLAVVFVPDGPLTAQVVGRVRQRLGERFGLGGAVLVAVPRASFDRTTSGKVQRTAMRAKLLRGGFTAELRAVELVEAGPRTMPDAFHRMAWEPRRLPCGDAPERVLVITDDPAIARAVPGALVADPGSWRASLAAGPSHVVLATPHREPPDLASDAVLRAVDACSTGVLEVLAGLADWSGTLITVGRGAPAALTSALVEVAALERPRLRAWHLDLPGAADDPEVLALALRWVHREPVVRWRDRPLVRVVRQVEPVRGENAVPAGSCWLVTGGAGGIGRAVLDGLGVRALVVGRSPRADPRYAQVDITDGEALEAAVAQAERAWGEPLTGVLHLAGHYDTTRLDARTPDQWRAAASAKVEGSVQVARVLLKRPWARLVAFSSMLSLLPAAGTSAYTAGNRFLEALCEQLPNPAHCLVWGLWRDTGINAGGDFAEVVSRGRLLAYSAAEARALFTAALHQEPGTLFLGVDPAGARAVLRPARPLEGAREPRRDVFGTEIPVGEAVPRDVVAVGRDRVGLAHKVREVLRQVVPEGIAPDQPFYEAGIGSVQLTRLHALLRDALGREFPQTALFGHPTEARLIRYLADLVEPDEEPARQGGRDRRVAIIGMAIRFPDAASPEEYWRNLLSGKVSARRHSRAELLAEGLPAALVDDPDFVPVTGALDDVAGFDAELFGISPAEAALTDPQHRLFLQVCREALEHGGYPSGRIGVYAGSGMQLYSLRTYLRAQLSDVDPGDQLRALRAAIGNEADFLATRVAYRLGLTGPAMSVRTACSTSLVAVHLAVQALVSGEADLALAGASALHVPRLAGYRFEEGSILSRTGVCRAFDAGADGTVGGNGVAAVLLKPLEAALADGDTVHAVIVGSAVNNDGAAKVGYTSPSVEGQVRVVRDALASGGIDPGTIGYVEAHGTGTRLGDPLEVAALREVFGARSTPLPLGSAKPNIGHLDSAAGMAGLVKAVLALQHGTIPPLANFRTPNPELDLGPMVLPTEPTPWPTAGPRRAGVSALGVGGTNAHVVLEEPPPTAVTPAEPVTVVPLSARTGEALSRLAARMAPALATASGPDVVKTLGAGRIRLPHRMVAWGATTAETAGALGSGGSATGVVPTGGPGPVVFAFTGQGADCTGAAAGLVDHPVAAEVLRRCLEHHRRTWGVDLLGPLLGEPFEWTTATAQPALVALQLAQVRLLESLGVRPDVVIGHSAGEIAALGAAGALSEMDCVHLAGVRGALLARVPPGAMLAVFGGVVPPGLELSGRNGPANDVYGGTPEAVEAAAAWLAERGADFRRLAVDRAFHTSAIEPVLDALARQAASLDWRPLRLPLVSGRAATALPPGSVPGPEHIRGHARETADYAAGVEHLRAQGCTTFVEVGPTGVLTALGGQWPDTAWIALRRRDRDSPVPALAALFCRGVEVDWAALAPRGRRIPLPAYPFQATRHWVGGPGGAVPPSVESDNAVLRRVRELTARQLGEPVERVPGDVPFLELGADSLLMINMVRELEAAFGVRVAMRELFEDVETPAALSALIQQRMSAAPQAAPGAEPGRAPELAPELAPGVAPEAAPEPAPGGAPAPVPEPGPAAPPPAVAPAAGGHEALVREQLVLMGRFADLMSDQLAVLSGAPPASGAPAAPRPAPVPQAEPRPEPQPVPQPVQQPVQRGPRPTLPAGSGMTGGRMTEQQRAHFADLVDRYTRRTARSKELAQRYRRTLADSRAVVGFRSATKELLYPLAAKRARGAHVEDVDGNTYVDITMGFGTLLFGHEPEFLTEAVRDHLAGGMRLGPRGEEVGQAAELLAELTGHERVAFATSGTEANSAAFRLARAHTGRSLIVMFDGSYHGHFDPVLGRTVEDGGGVRTVPVSAGIPASAVAETLVLGYGESSLDTIRRRADDIAAIVLEAVPSRHPDRRPVEFVRRLRELCDHHGIVLMFDEMLTGFRPHPRGAQGVFGVKADLATYGKVIGGGYPIGAIAGRADIMDWVDGGFWRYGDDSVPRGDTTFFGGTYIQHPVSMVAAKAVLTHLRDEGPGLQQRLNARTERLARTLDEFCAEEGFPVSVQHFGSLFRLAHRGNLELLFHHLVLEGVHVWEWRNFFLSTAHTDADVDFIADAVRNSLSDLRRGGFLPGGPAPRPRPRRNLDRIDANPRTTPDFSLYFFGDYPREREGETYAAIQAATRFADRAGLHAVWLPERHFDSFGGAFPNPSVLAAALAAQTERVRLHSGSVVLPLHDPIRVAEEWSVVDNLSGGRVGLGVASGWHARDFVLAPDAYGRHREAMREGVETIKALWRGDEVRRTAGNGEEVGVRLFPRPVQEMPPLYTAIVGNPDSYRQAAESDLGVITNLMSQSVEQLADNIALYRRTRAERGLDAGRVVVLLHTFLGEDTEHTRAEAFEPFCDYLRSSLSLFGRLTNSLGFDVDLTGARPEDVDFLLARAYERYCADRALIGSPEDAAAIVRRLTAAGVDEIACFVDFGLPAHRVLAGLDGIERLRRGFTARSAGGARPLTPVQRQIWYLDRVFPRRPTHTESQVVLLEGDLDHAALREAVNLVVARHDSLRSRFVEVDGEPRQVVDPARAVALPVLDDLGAEVAEAAARVMREETENPFTLAEGPLFDPRLVRLAPDRHLLVLRMHHLVVDTWSAELLTEEISTCYRAVRAGERPVLAPPGALPEPTTAAPDVAFWVDELADAPSGELLRTDRPRPEHPSGRGASVAVELDAGLTGRVKALARETKATLFTVLLAAFATALRDVGGQDDLVLGMPVAHRPQGAERTVGFFVNTLPLRVRVPDAPFPELVRRVRGLVLDAQEHGDAPLSEIARALGGPRDPLRNPLFDVVVEFDNSAVFELDLPGVRATALDAAVDRAPVDLTVFLTNLGDRVRARIAYAVDLFDESTPRRLLERFRHVLDAVTGDADRGRGGAVADAGSSARAEAAAADLARWQDGGPPPRTSGLLHGDLSGADGIAVVDRGVAVTRAELFARAEAVTAEVAGLGGLVGVHLPRGTDAVAAALGVLRAGLPYLPLDPDQPGARLEAILAQAEVSAVLTHSSLVAALPGDLPTLLIDRVEPRQAPEVSPPTPEDVAYVLFTSGSTGVPKGCVLEHRNIANAVAWVTRDLGITAEDRVSWFCGPGFDASHFEVWPALRAGAPLHVVPPALRLDPRRLRDWLVDERITIAVLPTPMAELVLDLDWPAPCALRHVLSGGDKLRVRPKEDATFRVWNIYGPTEAAVVSTWGVVPPRGDGPPTIGRPVPGTWVRVLDEDGRQVPVGVAGELLLGGAQVGREYLGAPEETARRFGRDAEGGRTYRTGDVVRWLPTGELEFLGRRDAQVQIRGHRVEPAEVEHRLRGLRGVREAAVRGWQDPAGDAYLAAYVVLAGDSTGTDELREELARRLPEYMVPRAWVVLPVLPTNANGKLDRLALPEPGGAVPVEERLRWVWCAELGVSTVDPDTTFFQLGGHSLNAIRLLNRVRAELGRTVDVLDFLRAPTIRAMAARLGADPRVERTAPAGFSQARQVLVTVAATTPTVLTVAQRFTLRGDLDVGALRTALADLVRRHAVLRTRFVVTGEEVHDVQQQVLVPEPVALPEVEVEDVDAAVARWVGQRFDLRAEPPLRAVLLRTAPNRVEFVLAMNHSIVDGWSMAVLIRDLNELYRAAATGSEPRLPAPERDFLDFVRWEQDHLADPATAAAVDRWVRDLGPIDVPVLPTDRPRAERASDAGAVWDHPLPPELTDRVDNFAAARGTTAFTVMFAVFAWLQKELTGARTAVVRTSTANRPHPGDEHVIGTYAHSSWLIAPLDGVRTFADLLDRATTAVWQRLALQSVPGMVVAKALGRPFDDDPPKLVFSLFGDTMPRLDFPGVAPASPVDVPTGGGPADQRWLTAATERGLELRVEYSTDLYDRATVARWGERYLALLRQALDDPESPVA